MSARVINVSRRARWRVTPLSVVRALRPMSVIQIIGRQACVYRTVCSLGHRIIVGRRMGWNRVCRLLCLVKLINTCNRIYDTVGRANYSSFAVSSVDAIYPSVIQSLASFSGGAAVCVKSESN